jgi:hypothetical protein
MGVNDAAEMLAVAIEECVRLEREVAVLSSQASRELARSTSADGHLRGIHQMELFGDCVECGQKFPCRTIQVLNVVQGRGRLGDGQPAVEVQGGDSQ